MGRIVVPIIHQIIQLILHIINMINLTRATQPGNYGSDISSSLNSSNYITIY